MPVRYKINEQDGIKILTEQEILEQYFPYWSEQMKKVGKEKEISREKCLEDFIVVHWAWREEE